jgi:hypothetical protein
VCLWAFGFTNLDVVGKPEPSAPVVVFHHPSYAEIFMMLVFLKNTFFLVRNEQHWLTSWTVYQVARRLQCVFVQKTEDQNTIQRLKDNMAATNKRLAICPHMSKGGALRSPDYLMKLPAFRTGPFRLSDSVQPVVFLFDDHVAKGNMYVSLTNILRGMLNAPWKGYKITMKWLAPMQRAENETVEDFAARVQVEMEKNLGSI